MPDESSPLLLDGEDVIGEQRAASLHQGGGDRALPDAAAGQEHDGPVLHNHGRGVQRRNPLPLQEEGKDGTQKVDLDL
jgi:hypothetical protein